MKPLTDGMMKPPRNKGDDKLIRKGEIIVAIDPDIRDMYCCEVMCAGEENKEPLLCRVLYMVAYPMQHAAEDSGIPHENPPLPRDTICHLRFTRRVETEDRNYRDYDTSFDRCLQDYLRRRKYLYDSLAAISPACRHTPIPDQKEFEILSRHARREFRSERTMKI